MTAGMLPTPTAADQTETVGNVHVADPAVGTVRVCAEKCPTCILRPGAPGLRPGRVRELVYGAAADESHVVCHETIGTAAPAICAGYAAHPLGAARALALRAVRAGIATLHLVPVPPKEQPHA